MRWWSDMMVHVLPLRGKLRLLERVSGSCLIGGGLWLALERR